MSKDSHSRKGRKKKADLKNWGEYWKVVFSIVGTIAIFGGILVPWLCQIYLPMINPNIDIESLEDILPTASIIVSFASAGLGIISIWQARESSTQMGEVLSRLEQILTGVNSVLKEQHDRSIENAKNKNQMSVQMPLLRQWDDPAEDEDTK